MAILNDPLAPYPLPGAGSTTVQVAVVEDDRFLRESLDLVLRADAAFAVAGLYANAETAVEHLPHERPDVVIMDIGLPGMSGIEAVHRLAARMPGTRFLMYTTHDDDDRVFEALRAGADGYLLKNSSPDEIVAALHELVAGGAPMSTAVARRVVRHFRPAPATTGTAIEVLTDREQEVLEQLAQGLLYKEIAQKLGISEHTVRQHIHKIYGKLHVQNRTEAVNRFFGR